MRLLRPAHPKPSRTRPSSRARRWRRLRTHPCRQRRTTDGQRRRSQCRRFTSVHARRGAPRKRTRSAEGRSRNAPDTGTPTWAPIDSNDSDPPRWRSSPTRCSTPWTGWRAAAETLGALNGEVFAAEAAYRSLVQARLAAHEACGGALAAVARAVYVDADLAPGLVAGLGLSPRAAPVARPAPYGGRRGRHALARWRRARHLRALGERPRGDVPGGAPDAGGRMAPGGARHAHAVRPIRLPAGRGGALPGGRHALRTARRRVAHRDDLPRRGRGVARRASRGSAV